MLLRIQQRVCAVLLLIVFGAFLLGTVFTFGDVPSAQAFDQQQDTLIHWLLITHTTHIYVEYWTCYRIAFVSAEQIICGVQDNNARPVYNRDTRFYTIVSSDPNAAYVFAIGSAELSAFEQKLVQTGKMNDYFRYTVAGHVIYKPKMNA